MMWIEEARAARVDWNQPFPGQHSLVSSTPPVKTPGASRSGKGNDQEQGVQAENGGDTKMTAGAEAAA